MNLWGLVLKIFGWKVDISAPMRSRCVICVAPHTSNWDFPLGLAAYKSLGRNANFLMKKFWFFFPLKYLLKSLGGIPVNRKKRSNGLTSQVIELFRTSEYVNLAVTPEATRSRNSNWKTGFLTIASGANVPVQLGVIDYKNKMIIIRDEFYPSDNIDKDLEYVKNYYRKFDLAAKYPNNFTVD